jgi:hypothetical protein
MVNKNVQWSEQVERAPFNPIHDAFPFQDRDEVLCGEG